jgi:hypothetical protein
MPSKTPAPWPLFHSFQHSLERARAALLTLEVEAIARRTGFLRRRPRKIAMGDLALALVAAGAESVLSLERVAHWIGLAARTSYSKQAFHQRLGPAVEPFLAGLAAARFGTFLRPLQTGGWLAPFQRVLLHDSTTHSLPDHLAAAFPGPRNAWNKTKAALKIQCVADLLQGTLVHLSLSGFTRNDQAASADILTLARPGDLILRDLGYFSLEVLARLQSAGAFFLTRWRRDLTVRDARTGHRFSLARRLQQQGRLDAVVWVGEQRLAMRLVALAVPEEVANRRRQRARTNRDRRLKPDQEALCLMGWNIFLTNVGQPLWPASVLAKVYALRWRVELIFKAWKSHLGLRQLNGRSVNLLRLSALSKLLFCALMVECCVSLETLCSGQRQVSLLRLARTLAECPLTIGASLLGIRAEHCLQLDLQRHLFYENRSDRKNFFQQLRWANRYSLG